MFRFLIKDMNEQDYHDYLRSIDQCNQEDIRRTSFKRDGVYRGILEHVSPELGHGYIDCIKRDFGHVRYGDMIAYIQRNDSIGNPHTHEFSFDGILTFQASPSSIRYVYHALLILETMRNHHNRNLKRIAELGCGYGGLFFAILFFRDLYFTDVSISHYYFIDFPQVATLISRYLEANDMMEATSLSFLDTLQFKEGDIDNNENDLFLVSNYCFTELSAGLREKYFTSLVSKVSGGFLLWQTMVTPLSEMARLPHEGTSEIETPQTSPVEPNYIVRF